MASVPSPAVPASEEAHGRFGRVWRWMGTYSPFQLLLVTPLLTAPLSALLMFTVGGEVDASSLGLIEKEWTRTPGRIDRTHYFYFDFWIILALLSGPGLLNLLVVRWLLHDLPYVRGAAALSLTLALLRTLVVPLGSVVWLVANVVTDAGLLIRVPINEGGGFAPSSLQATFSLLTTSWTSGLGMWLVTLGVWLAYEPLMERFLPHVLPPHERSPAEATRWAGFLKRR